ncbi:MAG: hypothetical protein KatS3mg108_1331 [Isosphaeraceae bacterium]|jgi:4-hydroxybenzoate polyprenyltransferase|nr:MAG: hypothetical protein KatS3mg108_1331 [Isosphaeraceae bacterium]
MSVRAYLRLVRLPNVLTAAADGLAGWLIAGGPLDRLDRWVPVLLASMSLYAGGIVLNDLCDLEVDRQERPERPLPSGAVGLGPARWLAAGLLGSGPIWAWVAGGTASLIVAGVLAIVVVGYDWLLRRTLVGPIAMGTCRALNLGLGMAAARSDLSGWSATMAGAMIGYGVFVAGLTVASRAETSRGQSRPVAWGLVLQNVALLGLALVVAGAGFGKPEPEMDAPRIRAEGLLVLALVALAVNRAAGPALMAPEPRTVMRLVRTGILALVWIDVALVLACRGLIPALLVAAWGPPAAWLARRIAAT